MGRKYWGMPIFLTRRERIWVHNIHSVTDSLCVIVCTYFTTVSVSEGTIIIFTLFLSLLATSLPTTYHKLDVALLA